MDGVLIIDKPSGISSFDVLRDLKRKLPERKMGYLGTLDPLATGVLVVFLGKATQLIPYFSEAPKEYKVQFELGKTSDTYDTLGKVIENTFTPPDEGTIEEHAQSFLGQQWQIQPPFSAVRYKGKRAYEYARKGEAIDLGKRQVIFFEITLLTYKPPLVEMRILCSSGTYIRSFVHELGQKLGCGAVMASLRRTRVGTFMVEQAKKLEDISPHDLLSPQKIIAESIDWKGRSQNEKSVLLQKFSSI